VREFRYNQTQRFTDALPDVFAFFADPSNLARITPDWLRFEIKSPSPVVMKAGALIDYTIRLHGIPLKWRSEITVWDPPFRFVDEQRIGPYRYWIHEHTFQEQNGETTVSDRVRYAVPGGLFVQRLLVARDIEKIFSHRSRVLRQIFDEVDASQTAAVK
jgi:ligand-binding SRPBCC domain-containing protein